MLIDGYLVVGTIDDIMDLLRPMTPKEQAEARAKAARADVVRWHDAVTIVESMASKINREAHAADLRLHEAETALAKFDEPAEEGAEDQDLIDEEARME